MMTWSDGSVYMGSFVDGKRTGQGCLVKANGCEYSGQWRENQCHGLVIFTNKKGDKYREIWNLGERQSSKPVSDF